MTGSPHVRALRALVVDDDRFMLNIISLVLGDLGLASVDTATDGAIALERLTRSSIDVLVCDLGMPEMDGIRLLGHVAAMPAQPAVILLSGQDPRILEAARHFAEAKALTILGTATKPVTHASFRSLLEAYRRPGEATIARATPTLDDQQLRDGLASHAFDLAYQPKVDLRDGRLVGVEALLRWQDVPPPEVVRAAEACALIDELTLAVFDIAVRDRAALARDGIDTNIACNVSMHNLHNLAMVDRIAARVADAGDAPSRYTIEVTETHVIEDLASVLEALIRLRLQGFRIAIDDYGTGAATMQFLMQLPSTELKIDRAFIAAATKSEPGRALLQSAIAIGQELGQDVVAEGVETEEEVRLLRTLGCRYAQGYFYGRPMGRDALAAWAAKH